MPEPGLGAGDAVEPLVHIAGAEMGYPGKTVLRGVELAIHEGDFVGLVGPNGSGKTTLLRTVLGLLRPLGGSLRRQEGARMGYVPQRQELDPIFPLSVLDVVVMGLTRERGPGRPLRRADREAALRALEHTGIADLAGASYRDLSGGQQQRTLIARALVAEPRLLLLDEPTNDMDVVGTRDIMELLQRLHREQGRAILMVSHILNVVANHCRRLAILHAGRLRCGPVEEVLTGESLSELYGTEVRVAEVDGQKVVLL